MWRFLLLVLVAMAASPAWASWESEKAAADRCFAEVNDDPSIGSTSGKLVLGEPTAAQLADSSIPTPEEAEAVRVGSVRVVPCRNQMLAALHRHHPLIAPAYELRWLQLDVVYDQLIHRRITFGNANYLIHESYLAFRERERRYIAMQDEMARREDAERDRAWVDEVRRWRNSTRDAYPSPRVVVCSWQGSTLICI